MSIITRPNKSGGGTDVVAGNDLLAAEWNGDLNTIYNDYNGNIKNVNCASDMGLVGSKLADAPAGITRGKINDGEVITSKIADIAIVMSKIKTAFVDWTPGFIVSAANAAYQTTGITTAMGLPLSVEIRGALNPPSGVYLARGNLQIYLNTANSTYYFVLGNIHDNIALDTTGFTYRFNYIPVS